MTTVSIIVSLDGKISVVVNEGEFEAASDAIKLVIADLQLSGIELSDIGEIERHRHDHEHTNVNINA